VSEHRPSFTGVRVLVPVTERRRDLADRLAAAGATVDAVEFIAIAPSSTPDDLAVATARWCSGQYDWMAVTSRNAVVAMAELADIAGTTLGEPQPHAKVATVGEATLSVCADLGLDVDLVPTTRANASGIVADMPDGPGRVLAPLGNLAAPVLARGLERKGWSVDTVEAYRTVDGPGLDASVAAALREGAFDAVLLTSGSVAERFAAQCADAAEATAIVAIGATTSASAKAAGLTVDAVATRPSYDGIVDALIEALGNRDLEHS
jgi:uroporphyrinogen-III synthase